MCDRNISGQTRVLGVLGCPVEHSLSPLIHNAAIERLGEDFVYVPFRVQPEQLGAALSGLRAMGVVGVNLTIPHKVAAMPYLDAISDEARAVGAVNTICCNPEGLSGFNTDGEGFEAPLLASGFHLKGSRAVVFGAGGAARSVVYRLLSGGCRVAIVNRTAERALRLIADMPEFDGNHAEWVSDGVQAEAAVTNADLLVNCTSLGMWPDNIDQSPVHASLMSVRHIVYDLVYRPMETKLLRDAQHAGARVITGEKMLVCQAAAAFKLWTGIVPPVDLMLSKLVDHLSGS